MRSACLLVFVTLSLFAQDVPAGRKQALDELKTLLTPSDPKASARISALDRTWEEWVARTGELPPDFAELRSQPFLPDPLEGVQTREQWPARREWIKTQFEQWFYGKMPPVPTNLRAVVTGEKQEGGVTFRQVRLEFGPNHRAKLHVELVIPPGKGPFPVFLTNHPRTRPWITPAVRRGYIGCIYSAADPIYGSPDDSDGYIEVFPEYDFSALARWAWSAMRAVDYLYMMPEVDRSSIGIAGHSRNGKQALLAAAFDDRITAAVPSSGNTGEGNPWRYTTDPFANETIEQITSNFPGWFHPRLRFFAGREHKLPVDQNSLMAMVAPRALLMTSAYSEAQGNPFGFEQAFRSVRQVYRLLGAENKLGLYLRAGEHPTTAEDIELFVDFFDSVFGRSAKPVPVTFINGYSWEAWRNLAKDSAASAPDRKAPVRDRILWLLGDEPPHVPFPNRATIEGRSMTSSGWLAGLFERPLKIENTRYVSLSFGDDLQGDLYLPASVAGKVPAVIWIHPYAYPTGYSRYGGTVIAELTKMGFAVLAFDQVGFGTRVHQARRFYERYPRWSLLGKMVADTRAAVSGLAALDVIESSQVFVAGYSLGGKVALWTAALDDRIAGVIAASAFAPLRAASPQTEGIRHYSHLHGLLPRLGFYLGNESLVPVDYDEIVSSIAPRPVYVRAPALDRYASSDSVKSAIGNLPNVRLQTPSDFNRFPVAAQKEAWNELAKWVEMKKGSK